MVRRDFGRIQGLSGLSCTEKAENAANEAICAGCTPIYGHIWSSARNFDDCSSDCLDCMAILVVLMKFEYTPEGCRLAIAWLKETGNWGLLDREPSRDGWTIVRLANSLR